MSDPDDNTVSPVALNALIVEDSEDDTYFLVRKLREGGFDPVFRRVEQKEDMEAALKDGTWDIVLSDCVMPHLDAFGAIGILKESGLDIPIIVVSGKIGEETAVETMKAGAHDYIMKNNLSRLVPAVKRELGDASVRAAKRRAEKALVDIEERYRTALESSNDAFALIEGDTILHVNRRFLTIFGYDSYTEVSDKSPFFMVHEDDRNAVMEYYGKRLRGEPVSPLCEFRATKRDGSIVFIEISVTSTIYKEKTVSLAYMRDVTSRKKAEEDRERLFNLSLDMFAVAGFDGYFRQLNPAWEIALGWKREILLGKPYIEFVHPDDRSYTTEVFRTLLQKGRPLIGFENRLRASDDSYRWISWNSYPIVADELVFSVARDITERKRDSENLAIMLADLRKATDAIIDVIVMAVEVRDPYTSGHQKRVAELAAAIAREMGLTKEEINGIHMAGVIHDLGKISIPAEILSMPRRLTDLEFSLVKTHSQIGYDILKEIQFMQPVAEMVLQHHEKLDGSGYPNGLKGDEILVGSRIIAVADVVEAIASHRPYRPALGVRVAIDEIKAQQGKTLDPAVVGACVTLLTEKGFIFR